MAVVATTTYLYVDTNLTQYFVQGTELVDMGPWSSSAFYNPNEVVQIGVDQYICLVANSNTPPTGIVDENWSTLVVVEEVSGSVASAGSDYYARWLAGQAYAYAGTAYFYATTAYQIGTDAYALAQTGTNLVIIETGSRIAADNAIIAMIGTAAVDLTAEQGTRSWQDQVLANAIAAETGSRIAADDALIAFVFGSIAVDLAAETGSRIAADLALTWAGTNEAATRYAADQQIISIVETGTNVANAAYALAQLGTIIPPLSTLPDVSIPSPQNNQVLAFDGSLWVAMDSPSQVAPGAFTFYTDDTASGTLSYYNALPDPTGNPEQATVVAITGFTPLRTFITPQVNRTVLDAGIWEFSTYAATQVAVETFVVITDVYTRSISGAETYLFSGTSQDVSATVPQMVTAVVAQGTYSVAETDKLVFAYSAYPATTATGTLYSAGTAHDTHVHTPLGYAHNDLDGLQGGASGERYHTTYDQNQALLGTSGYPSGSNPYVTYDSLVAEQGTRSQADQVLTTAIITEQGTRSQEDQNLQNQITTLADILDNSFAGTLALYMAQVLYGKTDTAFTIIDGVVAGRSDLYYSWEDFEYYGTTTGTNPLLTYGESTSWGADGIIFVNNLTVGVNGTDSMNLYATGTTSTFDAGTGWADSGTAWGDIYWLRMLGMDTFESYALGTLSSSGTEINGGSGWVGTAQCYTGSNRP